MDRQTIKKIYKGIAILLIGILIGYQLGYQQGISWTLDKASNFLEVDIDTELLAWGIYAYKNKIDQCYPDALIRNNTGNQT